MALRAAPADLLCPSRRRLFQWLTVCVLVTTVLMLTITSEIIFQRQQKQQDPQEQQQQLGSRLRPLQPNEDDVRSLNSLPPLSNDTVTSSGVRSPDGPASNITKPPLYPPGFQLSDLDNFTFVINNDVCGRDSVDLVMLVISDTRLPSVRAAIRNVLPSTVLEELRIRRVFLLAELASTANTSAEYDRREAALQAENYEHADLVVGSFHDAYHNLTYKHLMGLHWAAAYCPQAHHIVKMDHDIALDVFRLHARLQTAPRRLTIIGTEFAGTQPIRDPANKWFVTRREFAADRYPTYMSGSVYVTTPDVAARLAAGSAAVPFFWVDDAFVTGVLRERVAPDVTILDFTRLWGRPDASGRTASLFTLQLSCLYECTASREASVAQCDTLFGQENNNMVVMRMFYKQAEYCYRRRQGCVRLKNMPDICHGGVHPPLRHGIPQQPQDIWDVR